ncbi:hypothetical protein M404DRAFT_133917, partial [Pisolithus tinctorius Marx 270]
MHAQEEQPTGRQYDCVCIKYGFGRLHKVSHTAWHQHLASASSEEERQRICTVRLLGERISSLPTLTASSPLDRDNSVPPSLRRAEARRDPIDNDQLHHPDDRDDFFPPPPSPPQSPSVEQDTRPPPAPRNPMDPEEQDAPPPPPPSNSVDEALPQHRQIIYQRRARPQINIQRLCEDIILPKLTETMEFVSALSVATLEDPVAKLSTHALECLRNPPCQPLRIDNPGHRHSISVYLATEHSSKDAYEKICRSTARNFPG